MSHTEHEKSYGASGGLAAEAVLESGTDVVYAESEIKARGYWEQVWRRFKRDKVALGGGIFVIFLILVAIFGGPIAGKILGHGPNDLFYTAVTDKLLARADDVGGRHQQPGPA